MQRYKKLGITVGMVVGGALVASFWLWKRRDYIGVLENLDDTRYEGHISFLMPNGFGKLYDQYGHLIYSGYWAYGVREGEGTEYLEQGIYTGSFLNDQKHGKGKLVYTNGAVYEGDWVKGQILGFGNYENREYTYSGSWAKGLKNGKGKVEFKHSKIVFEGQFIDDQRCGEGSLVSNKFSFHGFWMNDKPEGRGTLSVKGSRVHYDGDWKDGKMSGEGAYTFENGNVYVGKFADGKRHGDGMLCRSSGDVIYNGQWIDDVPMGDLEKNEIGVIKDIMGVFTE
jgi:hypothetical protein